MAEQFLEEIYEDAMIIEQIREYVEYTLSGRERDARRIYNQAAQGIERILPGLQQEQPQLAEQIVTAALAIREHFADVSDAVAITESRLLPALFSYMQFFTGIEVEEGQYCLKSADSGFLTIRDLERNITLHSTYDPMWEAYGIARSVFAPEKECYHILGMGLGYLPYQLWNLSEGAVRLVIYEEDPVMIEYAKAYGVLERIDDKCVELVHCADPEKLAETFLQNIETEKDAVVYISPQKKEIYRSVCDGRVAVAAANYELDRSMRCRTAINMRMNKQHKQISFAQIKERFGQKNWIVVSAGPSLDDSLEFLRERKGEYGIIAVNTVLRRLFREGIRPDLVAAADQYVQMREHIEGIGEQTDGIPLVAERRLNWQYLQQYRGPVCFVRSEDEENASEEVWSFSGSVAGLALETAVRLGAKKVYLVGQDLAYPDGKTYAEGMPYHADAESRGSVLVPAVHGGMVPTSEAFCWFRMGLEEQIARYDQVEFFNLSKNGALIRGCKELPEERKEPAEEPEYDTYIVITPKDFERLKTQYGWMVKMLPGGRLIFVGSSRVGELVEELGLGERVGFLNEDSLLPFRSVWDVLNDHMSGLLNGEEVPRPAVGWYYQQFLKLELAEQCNGEYYMTWDGDTIPCRPVKMFAEDGRPYLDNKNEYHELYFKTMEKLIPGLHKVVRSSFISEHLMFHAPTVKELKAAIAANAALEGKNYWEKILRAIDPMEIHQSAFSEFETYGTFVALRDSGRYKIRNWHSFRLGGEFFDPNTICERDYVWLGKDFDAISFEKGHSVKEGNGNLFDNPEYQKKMSARKMLEVAQEGAGGGYIESWDGSTVGTDPLA
ncbi:MAG: DUF115 domain-containing protein [Lachnospiraceae bacterium]|nr:DUF115 domain-containing protein [Lachnospiraceae bacterium]